MRGGRSRASDRNVRDRTNDHVGRDRGNNSKSRSQGGKSHHHKSNQRQSAPAPKPPALPSKPVSAPVRTAAPSPPSSNLQRVVQVAQTVINPGPTIAQKAAELSRSIVASATTKPAPALLSPPKSVLVPSPSSPPSNLQKFVHVTQNVINATPILTQKAAETARNFAASAAPSFPSLPMPAPASQTQQINPGKESQEASIERLQRHIQRLIAERKAQSQNGEAPKAIPPPSQPHTTAAALHRAVQIGNTLIATPNPLTRAIETGKELFKNSSPNTTPTTPQAANEKPISPPKPPVSTGNSFVDYHSGLFRGAKRASQEHAKEFLPNVVNTVELAVALHQNPLGQVLKTAQATHELISVLKDANSSEVLKSLAPELSKLVFENEKLSDAEKGELTGYIIVKYVPYVIPLGAAAKAPTVAQRVTAVTAEVRSALKLADEIEKSRKAVQAAKTVEATAKEAGVAQKLAATTRSQTIEKGMLESFQKFEKAEAFLKFYRGQYFSEKEAKDLIHQFGINTFPKPKGIPENYKIKITKNGAGIKYVHPDNPHTSIRVMPGKPHSPNPCQQKPYIIQKKDGQIIDKFGKVADGNAPEVHIPLDEFTYKGD